MKNKKGFTLIEIIVVIALVAVIGTTVTIVSVKNMKENKTKELKKLNNQILEAADVFLSVEKDDNNENYEMVINSGAKGVKIPISYLVENGYVSLDTVNSVYKLNELDNSKNYYVLAVNGGEEDTQDYCDVGDITFSLSWMVENKPVYLCKNYKNYVNTTIETITNIQEVQNNVRLKVSLDKNAVSEEYYNSLTDDAKTSFVKDENGIFTLNDENVGKIYSYYRCSVDNNYLKLGKDSNGNDLIWRIVYLDDTNKAKLVLDEEIQLSITKKNGEIYYLQKGDKILDFYRKSKEHYYILNYSTSTDTRYKRKNKNDDYYTVINYSDGNLLNEMISLEDNVINSNNIYYKQLIEWYNTTDLNTYSIITNTNNFCKNNYYKDAADDYENYKYEPSDTFACIYGRYSNYSKDKKPNYNNGSLFYSSPVGFLTYGDVVRAGLYDSNNNLIDGGSYLLKDSNNAYPLVDLSKYYYDSDNKGMRSEEIKIYYIDNGGLNIGRVYLEDRGSSTDDKWEYYSLVDENGEYIYDTISNNGKNGFIWTESKFLANSIKPSIVVDLTKTKILV